MNDAVISKEEQECIVFMINEFLKRDGHVIDDVAPEFKSLYYKCGGSNG